MVNIHAILTKKYFSHIQDESEVNREEDGNKDFTEQEDKDNSGINDHLNQNLTI